MKGEVPRFCFSNTTLLLYDLLSLCSFIHSHPLYFAYFLFFSPYLLRLLSFLCPLLFSTTLFLVALLTVSPHANSPLPDITNSQCGFFLITFQAALDVLRTKLDGDPKLGLIEPLVSLVSELDSWVETQEQAHNVGDNHVHVGPANRTVGNGSYMRSCGSELEWKILASEGSTHDDDEEESNVRVSQEFTSLEITSSGPGSSSNVSQLPKYKVDENAGELQVGAGDVPKSHESEVTYLSCDSFACGVEAQELSSYKVGEKPARFPLENDQEDVESSWPESSGFDLETASDESQGLIYNVQGNLVDETVENDPKGYKSCLEVTPKSPDSLGCGLIKTSSVASKAETHNVEENPRKIHLGNAAPEAYKSQEGMYSTSASFGFDLETDSAESQAQTYQIGENPEEVDLGNDPEEHTSQESSMPLSCIDSFWCGLKTTSMVAQAPLYKGVENPDRVPLGNDPEAYESQDGTSSSSESYGFDLETASTASQALTYKTGGSPVEVALGNDPHPDSSFGNFGCGLETATSMGSQALVLPGIQDELEADISVSKEGENHFQVANGNFNEKALRGPMSPESVCSSPGGFGSMRKEKEWRRTLACKLYEERMTVDGIEGMDSLWETYDSDSGKMKVVDNKEREKVSKEKKKVKKQELDHHEEEEGEGEEEEEEDMDGQLCCLQALRFSTGKMHLGMRRPSLVKISKAFKGMGLMLVRGKGKSFR